VAPEPLLTAEDPLPAPAAPTVGRPVATRLGGLFLLLPVALDRGLYADFTRPADTGIALDPWRLIAMLGAELLDGIPDEDDAVWPLLDDLAAAPETEPAEDWPRWVAELAADLRPELAVRLGRRPREVGNLLLRRHAAVLVAATRVDVRFQLDELQVEIRLAGIDRDPGWVPAAAHTVAFHFD
jgi:hypothetical protein